MKDIPMKKFAKKHRLTLIGLAFGAIAGYLYWRLIGCNSGSCAITSKPLNSVVYGATMGGLLFSIFQKNKKESV